MLSIACSLLLALFAIPPLLAQVATGGVTGTVNDTSGAALSDAQVTLSNNQTVVAMGTRSTSTGTYVFDCAGRKLFAADSPLRVLRPR